MTQEYRILTATNEIDLEVLVNKYLGEGWRCKGGLVVKPHFFHQAMIKEYE